MILGHNDGTKIDSAVFFSKLKMANRSKKIINVRANLTTQIYQASVGEVCREERRPLPSCNPFMPVWLSCSHSLAVYGSFATSTPSKRYAIARFNGTGKPVLTCCQVCP